MNFKTSLVIVTLIAFYFGSTWFFFGSSHPCEILIVRQKQHYIEMVEKRDREDLESWQEIARKVLPEKDYVRFVSNIEEYSGTTGRQEIIRQRAAEGLRQKTREMTPAQCAWQALTWNAPATPSVPHQGARTDATSAGPEAS